MEAHSFVKGTGEEIDLGLKGRWGEVGRREGKGGCSWGTLHEREE